MATNKKVEDARDNLGIEEPLSQAEEFDMIAGFLKAGDVFEEVVQPIEIRRGGKPLFKFHVHPYTQEQLEAAQNKATTKGKNPKGAKYPKIVTKYDSKIAESYLIYLCTTDEDKKTFWDNPQFKDHYNVIEGYELVDKVLLPGEKQYVIELLDALGGFAGDDEEAKNENDIDFAKNS